MGLQSPPDSIRMIDSPKTPPRDWFSVCRAYSTCATCRAAIASLMENVNEITYMDCSQSLLTYFEDSEPSAIHPRATPACLWSAYAVPLLYGPRRSARGYLYESPETPHVRATPYPSGGLGEPQQRSPATGRRVLMNTTSYKENNISQTRKKDLR